MKNSIIDTIKLSTSNLFMMLLVIVFGLFLQTSCKKDENVVTQNPFSNLSIPATESEQHPVNGEILNQTVTEESGEICTEYVEAISATNSEFLPNNFEDKYPGQILLGTGTIESGAWNPLLGGIRNGLNLVFNGPTIEGDPSYYMETPSLHEYNNILNQYKQQPVVMNSDARFSYKIIDVKSIEQLKLKIGADLKVGRWVDISGSFENSEFNEYNYFVVEMIQEHASVNVSLPPSPEDLYLEQPTPEQLGEWSPLILTSIKYGRAAYFILKSSASKSETKAALDSSLSFWKVDIDTEISQETQNALNSMEIDAVIYGGEQESALATIDGVTGIKNYLKSGFIDNNAFGVPLGYKFKYISDFSDAKIVSNLTYTYRDCSPLPQSQQVCIQGNSSVINALFPKFPVSTGNDTQFADGGRCNAKVSIIVSNDRKKIYLKTDVKMYEWDKDPGSSVYTEGTLADLDLIYTAPSGFIVDSFLSDTSTEISGFDDDNGSGIDIIDFGVNQLARVFKVMIETVNSDVVTEGNNGSIDHHSYIDVELNDIKFNIKEE